jgi:hypothetical protein
MKEVEFSQEDIILTRGYNSESEYTSTDNITNLIGVGDHLTTALQDHIVELILYYEKKLRSGSYCRANFVL